MGRLEGKKIAREEDEELKSVFSLGNLGSTISSLISFKTIFKIFCWINFQITMFVCGWECVCVCLCTIDIIRLLCDQYKNANNRWYNMGW